MAGGKKLDRRGSGPLWFLMLAVVIYVLYSAAVAYDGKDDCGGGSKSWHFFPPEWVCDGTPGFG
jgi:hypothetical protein